MFCVTLKVFIPGCFEMESIIDGVPFCDAYPCFTAGAITTSATSATRTMVVSVAFTTVLPNSSKLLLRPIPRRLYSFPKSRTTPAPMFTLIASAALSSSSIVTPYKSIRTGSAST